MRRRGARLVLCAAVVATLAVPARAESFLAFYGGYAFNDGDRGADDATVYGVRWGVESPVGGGQVTLDFDRDDVVEFDSLLFSSILNLISRNRTRKDGQVLTNAFSTYLTLGAGLTEFEDAESEHTFVSYTYGLGAQFRFNRRVGLRFEALAIDSPSGDFRNYQGTTGLAFLW